MSSGPAPLYRRWIEPERQWRGQRALIPVATCYRSLDILLWLFCGFVIFAMLLVYLRGPELMHTNPVFWVSCSTAFPLLLAAVFRGWPFSVRAITLIGSLLLLALCASAVLGLTPNWSFVICFLVALSSLFWGARAGLALVVLILVTHLLVAWGWISGRLPAFMPSAGSVAEYMDYTSGLVWTRVLVLAAGLLSGMVVVLHFVLLDLRRAEKEANAALQMLAAEQEHRARAEEARFKTELASREAQKFEALGRLASGVAHDFNNALCVIKCWSSYLSETSQDLSVMEAMTAIRTATDSAAHMTSHLLAFSRSDAGRNAVVDLAEVVRLEGKTLSRLLPKNVRVVCAAPDPVYVRLGRGQMQEIILNLAINARDAMPQGGQLELRVACVALEGRQAGLPAGRYARFEVSDTGVGMDQATQARIFEPFFTTKQLGQGTGLGLAMVYGLVAAAEGGIAVQSAPGRGTCFTLHLPETSPIAPAPVLERLTITSPTRFRVLVADHQAEIRLLIDRILSQEKFPTVTVADGDQATAALLVPHSQFGLLLVDAVMPGASTADLIALALRQNPACRVVIMAAVVKDQPVLEKVRAGIYHQLPKPFDVGQLREVVNLAMTVKP